MNSVRNLLNLLVDQIAIYDATNTTKDRRQMIKTFCNESGIQVIKLKIIFKFYFLVSFY